MGLDQYATARKGEPTTNDEGYIYYEDSMELAYWRKHPNLHGWMELLAEQKGLEYGSFNGIELELTWEDLDALERADHGGIVGKIHG